MNWSHVVHHSARTPEAIGEAEVDVLPPMPVEEMAEENPDSDRFAADAAKAKARREEIREHARASQIAAAVLAEELGWEKVAVQSQGNEHTVQVTVSRLRG